MISFAVMVCGLCLFLSSSYARGQEERIPSQDAPTQPAPVSPFSGCLPLPEQVPEGTVAVYVAKMQEKSGFVCVRAVNGLPTTLSSDGFRLQRREDGQFHDFTDKPPATPPGLIIGQTLIRLGAQRGARLERELPLYSPAPPGMYRACFHYTLYASMEQREVCSEEFSLP